MVDLTGFLYPGRICLTAHVTGNIVVAAAAGGAWRSV